MAPRPTRDDHPTHVRIHDLAEFVVTIPYALGFTPADSLVVALLHGSRLLALVRADLPAVGDFPDTADGRARRRDWVSGVVDPAMRTDADRALLVAYQDDPATSLLGLDLAAAGLRRRTRCELGEVALVRGGRLIRLRGEGALDDPAEEGQALPEPSRVEAVAEFVALGRAPLKARSEIGRLLATPLPAATAVGTFLSTSGAHRSPAPASVTRAWRAVLEPGTDRALRGVGAGRLGLAVASLCDHAWRDALIHRFAPDLLPAALIEPSLRRRTARLPVPDPSSAALLTERLLALARCVTEDHPHELAEICALVAAVHWGLGDGVLAAECARRALSAQPGHTLAGLLATVIGAGVPPPGMAGDPEVERRAG